MYNNEISLGNYCVGAQQWATNDEKTGTSDDVAYLRVKTRSQTP